MSNSTQCDPTARLADARSRIAKAAARVQRPDTGITLIAVSKTYDADAITPVIKAGQRDFGENRVQEAANKWPDLKARNSGITLHLIGPLQSNKARDAVALFDAIHSIDRPKIARAIAQEMERQNRMLDLFVQVNTGEEPQKAGIAPNETSEFLRHCRDDLGLTIKGLMCIPPLEEEPAVHFAFLAKLAADNGVQGLSMGMSADFETAVELGATHVRVGSAIFGART